MIMPSPRRTVIRTAAMLARLGLTGDPAYRLIARVARQSAARLAGHSDMDTAWLGDIERISLGMLAKPARGMTAGQRKADDARTQQGHREG